MSFPGQHPNTGATPPTRTTHYAYVFNTQPTSTKQRVIKNQKVKT